MNGEGAVSSSVEVTSKAREPDSPTDVTFGEVTTKSIALSWTAPLEDGGSEVTGYSVYF